MGALTTLARSDQDHNSGSSGRGAPHPLFPGELSRLGETLTVRPFPTLLGVTRRTLGGGCQVIPPPCETPPSDLLHLSNEEDTQGWMSEGWSSLAGFPHPGGCLGCFSWGVCFRGGSLKGETYLCREGFLAHPC